MILKFNDFRNVRVDFETWQAEARKVGNCI